MLRRVTLVASFTFPQPPLPIAGNPVVNLSMLFADGQQLQTVGPVVDVVLVVATVTEVVVEEGAVADVVVVVAAVALVVLVDGPVVVVDGGQGFGEQLVLPTIPP